MCYVTSKTKRSTRLCRPSNHSNETNSICPDIKAEIQIALQEPHLECSLDLTHICKWCATDNNNESASVYRIIIHQQVASFAAARARTRCMITILNENPQNGWQPTSEIDKETEHSNWACASERKRKLFTYFYNVFVIQHNNRLEYEFTVDETILFKMKPQRQKIRSFTFIYSELWLNETMGMVGTLLDALSALKCSIGIMKCNCNRTVRIKL